MKKNLQAFRIAVLFITLSGFSFAANAQKDTTPPVIDRCGDTIKVQVGSVWVEPNLRITDNQTDSMSIVVKKTWNNTGPVNSLVRSMYSRNIEATDTNGNKTQCTIYYLVDDFIAPVIDLNTTDTVCHKLSTAYNAVQPSATDNYSPSSKITLVKISSNVNPNIPGIYTEVYEATDASGNKTYKTRFVKVSANCLTSAIADVRNAQFVVYPNPANSEFTLNAVHAGQTSYIRIVSTDGKTIFSSAFNAPLTIDSRSFAAGIYHILLKSGEIFFVQKLVIQH